MSVRSFGFCSGVLVFVAVILSACGSGDDGSKQAACDGSVSDVQDLVADIVDEVPGFAGCAPDPENPGGYVVNQTTGPIDLEVVRAAILSHRPTSSETLRDAPLRSVVANVSQISLWYREIPPRLLTDLPSEHQDWRWFSSDQDEVNDQIILQYDNEDARAWAQDWIIDKSGTPPGVIVAVLGDPGQED